MPSVYDYFLRACGRHRASLSELAGEIIGDSEGNTVIFQVQSESGLILGIDYRCTTCVTLVALCEHLAELVAEMDVKTARQYSADNLLELHPEIPSTRHDRAELAVRALQSALDRHPTE